ncbi:MAG: polysaccharide lyase 6 family protein [Bacteroidia bacterium]|nr:polysaccharide lyase 6 family protein [Bacteroidia bacterium]
MKNKRFFQCSLFLFIFILNSYFAFAGIIKVNSVSSLKQAINNASPGDRIIVANGVYTTNESILISKQGNASQPITIEAETIGGVEINGANGFMLSSPSSYIIIKGFKFTNKTGTNRIETGATHCIITRNVFECASAGSPGSKPYLNISGDDNEISYNIFQNKKDEGQMISVQGPGSDKMAKRTWIHHNYFYNFPPTANNCSAIQIGLSGRSMDSAFCVVEYNLFIKTEGENEGAICHKSCNNIIRFNTFGERSEEMSLRHGNKSQVYGNFFLNTTGLRFSGDDHLIYNNYFQGCSKAIVCTNGDGEVKEGSKLTCHDRPDRVKVVYNTIINCESSYQMPVRNNGLGAVNITFANNIIQGGEPVSVQGSYPYPVWKGNILWNTTGGSMPFDSYTNVNPRLVPDNNGVYHLTKRSPAISAGIGNYPFVTIDIDGNPRGSSPDTGADQYTTIPIINRPLTITDVGPYATVH